jgi:hypothetical protein
MHISIEVQAVQVYKCKKELAHEPRGLGHALQVVLVEGGGSVDEPDSNILLLRRG